MRSIRQNKKTKKIVIFVTIVIAVGITLSMILLRANPAENYPGNSARDLDVSNKQDESPARNSHNSDSSKESVPEKTKTGIVPDTSSNPREEARVEMNVEQQGSNIIVYSKLYGIDGGSCILSITKNKNTLKKNAEVLYQPSYSTCMGFSIERSELGKGTWKLNLLVNTNNFKLTDSVSLEVL